MSLVKKGLDKVLEAGLKAGFFAKSGLYFLESSPILRTEQWIRFKKFQPPEQIISEKELFLEVQSLMNEDIESFKENSLPLSLIDVDNPASHIKNLFKIYVDSIDVAYNKKFNKNKVFKEPSKVDDEKLPEYYKRNFHNQTDGYLSEDSAKMYEHQVEILFRGTADMMRRLILKPLLSHFKKTDSLKIIEVGAGTGVSTKILSKVFENAQISAYDLSQDYLDYAFKTRPFHNTSYFFGNGEELSDVPDESVDLWCSTFMFHELPHKARIQTLKEAFRILKPSGLIAIVDSIQLHDRRDFEEILSAFPKNFHEPYYKNYTQKPLEKDLEKSGFKKISTHNKFLSKVVSAVKS